MLPGVFQLCDEGAGEERRFDESRCTFVFAKGIKDKLCFEIIAVQLINHPEVTVRRNAGMAFGMMSGVPQIRDFLAKEQDTLIGDLTKLVQDEDPIVAEFAIATIANLSTRYMLKESMVEAQSLPYIVKLVSSSDPDTKKHALVTLKSLCNDPEVLAELGALDAVQVVLQQLTSEFPLIQQLSLEVVYCMLQENVSRETVTSGSLLENFVFFIENREFSDLHCYALRCIGTCMKEPKVVQNFKETGLLVRVIEAIKLAEGNFSDDTSSNLQINPCGKSDQLIVYFNFSKNG